MDEFKEILQKNTLDSYKGIYLVDDMTEARKYLIETFYKARSRSKTELESKLKCGMLTQDVIDYFVHGKKDSIGKEKNYDAVESQEQSPKIKIYNLEEGEEDEEEDCFEKIKNNSIIASREKILNNSDKRLVKLKQTTSNIKKEKRYRFDLISDENESNIKKRLSHLPLIDHACKKICLENIKKSTPTMTRLMLRFDCDLVFVCDICWAIFYVQEMALLHLNKYDHISASEFLIRKSDIEHKRSLKSIVNRCSIKSLSKRQSVGVFCPKCLFYFKYKIFLFFEEFFIRNILELKKPSWHDYTFFCVSTVPYRVSTVPYRVRTVPYHVRTVFYPDRDRDRYRTAF